MCVCSASQLCPTLYSPWTIAHQALLPMEFSRQGYWSEVPFPPPGDLSDPGMEPASLTSPALAGRFFTTSTTWEGLTDVGRCHSCHVIPAPAFWWVHEHTQVLARTSSHRRTQATDAEAKPASAQKAQELNMVVVDKPFRRLPIRGEQITKSRGPSSLRRSGGQTVWFGGCR